MADSRPDDQHGAEMTEEITRPKSPGAGDVSSSIRPPSDYIPELALIEMQKEYAKKWPTPTVISKQFAVFDGIWKSLNHTDDNKTYYDCSHRVALYNHVGNQSVNIDGKLFNSLFTMWNKPKVVMQGVTNLPSGFEEEQPGFFSRIIGRLTGKSSEGEKK
jgi:hypothetical protein